MTHERAIRDHRLRRWRWRALSLVAAASIAACETAPAPRPLPQDAATIVGTRVEYDSAFRRDLRAAVTRVDGKPLGPSADQPLVIGAGDRAIAITVSGGENMLESFARHGTVTALIEIEPGRTYVVRAMIRRDLGADAEASAWIENDDGVAVSDEMIVMLSAGRRSMNEPVPPPP